MGWPTPQEYNEAIQNPGENLSDVELRAGTVQLDVIGLPRVASGNFASVYKMRCENRFVAVRCFLYDVSDLALRYERIAAFVMTQELPYSARFQYIKQGILVNGSWFPVLKMDWVDGQPLDQYVKKYAAVRDRMLSLAEHFKTLILDLKRYGIAHGDLQHGNILVINEDSELRLVDYDGMFVPQLAGCQSNELGHRNYQHPLRSMHDFGSHMDNFSAWSIYTSLRCIGLDPELLAVDKQICDESLLFLYRDYRAPLQSPMFSTLENHSLAAVRDAARRFRSLLLKRVSDQPFLDAEFDLPADMPPVSTAPQFSFDANLPDWLRAAPSALSPIDSALTTGGLAEPVSSMVPVPIGPAEVSSCPSLEEYLSALKEPRDSLCRFADLREAVFPTINGQVKHIASDHSIVVPVFLSASAVALKLFLKPDAQRTRRFEMLQHLEQSAPPELARYLITFEYFECGIKVKNRWYPVLRMPWLGGVTMRQLLKTNDRGTLLETAKQFRKLSESLVKCDVVHGDIEPGNIMIVGGELRLLDYDTMQQGGNSLYDLPQQNYRHPDLSSTSTELNDNFSAWVVDTTLVVLAECEAMRDLLRPSGDLFDATTEFDKKNVYGVLARMLTHKDVLLQNRALLLQSFLRAKPEDVPPLLRDAGLDREYASQQGLRFHHLSDGRVSPDVRAPLMRLVSTLGSVARGEAVQRASESADKRLFVAVFTAFALLALLFVICSRLH